MHTWETFSFLAFAAGCIVATASKAYALALVAAGLALTLVPSVFELSS